VSLDEAQRCVVFRGWAADALYAAADPYPWALPDGPPISRLPSDGCMRRAAVDPPWEPEVGSDWERLAMGIPRRRDARSSAQPISVPTPAETPVGVFLGGRSVPGGAGVNSAGLAFFMEKKYVRNLDLYLNPPFKDLVEFLRV